jgi:C1A family cysteine protease
MLRFIRRFNPRYIKLGGWRPDPNNKEYWEFDQKKLSLTNKAAKYDDVDLRKYTSPRHNQRSTGSCVAQSLIKALEIKRIMKYGHSEHVDLSVCDLYWNARRRMTPPQVTKDEGTYIHLACDVLRKNGVCREVLHPFTDKNIYQHAPVMASREGRLNRIKSHFKITSSNNRRLDDMIFNLKAGNPIVFGTKVGTDWMNYKGGREPLGVESDPKGGHAITVIGYEDGVFIIENSWSNSWGDDGFGYVREDAFKHPSFRDLWVIVDGSEAWREK